MGGGGGGGVLYNFWYWWNVVLIFYEFKKHFFLEKHIFLISFRVLCYFFWWKYWKVPLHLLAKWEVVSPNSRWGQWEAINISSILLFWFVISNVCVVGGGGGGCNVFLAFYVPLHNLNGRWFSNISFNVFFVFLAPPAERQRSFSNTDLSVVRLPARPFSHIYLCYSIVPKCCRILLHHLASLEWCQCCPKI